MEAVLLGIGDSHVELLRPLSADSAGRAGSSSATAPGMHHVAYRTEDIDSTLESVKAAGLELIDEQPRTGIRRAAWHSCTRSRPAVCSPSWSSRQRNTEQMAKRRQANRHRLPRRAGAAGAGKDEEYQGLRKALGNEKADRWYELKTQDSEVAVDLAQVVYVRLDTDEHRVGF